MRQHWPKPFNRMAWSKNQRKETARHEYFFPLSLLETVMDGRKVIARGGLFCVRL